MKCPTQVTSLATSSSRETGKFQEQVGEINRVRNIAAAVQLKIPFYYSPFSRVRIMLFNIGNAINELCSCRKFIALSDKRRYQQYSRRNEFSLYCLIHKSADDDVVQ